MITGSHISTHPTSWLAVTRAQMENQLSRSADYQSDETESLIAAAAQWVQKQTSSAILRNGQARTMTLDAWPSNSGSTIYIPHAPIYSGGTFAVSYIDTSGTSQNLTADNHYKINAEGTDIPYITPIGSWPTLYSTDHRAKVTITYTVGPATVPQWAQHAVMAYGTFLKETDMSQKHIAESLVQTNRIYFSNKLNN